MFKTAFRSNLWRGGLALGLLSFMALSCSNPVGEEDLDITAKDNEEAELIALCLSGELAAPDYYYNRVLKNLAAVRSQFGPWIEPVSRIKFTSPWTPSRVVIGFDAETFNLVKNGEYHAWDELNTQYHVVEINITSLRAINVAILNFENRLHPRRLAELYAYLPGVRYAEHSSILGGSYNIYPRQTPRGITYLFRDGWGDCWSGCIYNEYWYFVVEGSSGVFLIGHWAPHLNPEEPEWWSDAKENKEQFSSW